MIAGWSRINRGNVDPQNTFLPTRRSFPKFGFDSLPPTSCTVYPFTIFCSLWHMVRIHWVHILEEIESNGGFLVFELPTRIEVWEESSAQPQLFDLNHLVHYGPYPQAQVQHVVSTISIFTHYLQGSLSAQKYWINTRAQSMGLKVSSGSLLVCDVHTTSLGVLVQAVNAYRCKEQSHFDWLKIWQASPLSIQPSTHSVHSLLVRRPLTLYSGLSWSWPCFDLIATRMVRRRISHHNDHRIH